MGKAPRGFPFSRSGWRPPREGGPLRPYEIFGEFEEIRHSDVDLTDRWLSLSWTGTVERFTQRLVASENSSELVDEIIDHCRAEEEEPQEFAKYIQQTVFILKSLESDFERLSKKDLQEKLRTYRISTTNRYESIDQRSSSAKQEEQPREPKEELELHKFSTKALMQELTTRPDAPEETRQRLLWDIADLGRPKWTDKEEKPDSLPLELRHAPAPVFLKIAWPDEIDDKGRVYTQRIRHYDRPLMTAVEHYLANRKGRDPLHAKGLTLITGPVPFEPKEKMRPARERISAMHVK